MQGLHDGSQKLLKTVQDLHDVFRKYFVTVQDLHDVACRKGPVMKNKNRDHKRSQLKVVIP